MEAKPAIAQLVEHLTVEFCSNQMVPGSIPGGRIFLEALNVLKRELCLKKGTMAAWCQQYHVAG